MAKNRVKPDEEAESFSAAEESVPTAELPSVEPPEEPEEIEVKQGFMPNVAALRKIRVDGLRGGYGKAFFNDDCIAEVDAETAASIASHWPAAEFIE